MAILSLPCGYELKDVSGIFQPRFISFGAERKIVWLRFENRSAEIEKSFGAELFMGLYNERKLKDEFPIFHSIIYYVRGSWPMA